MKATSNSRSGATASNVVEAWFGEGFRALDPQLQALHRRQGKLHGAVHFQFGTGLAGIAGRRLACRLGLPPVAGSHQLDVEIGHDASAMWWNRTFDNRHSLRSTFFPVGRWPNGHWTERTGSIDLRLQVAVNDGGWHWRVAGARLGSVPIPLWFMPRVTAYKRIEMNRYRFFVGFSLPMLGELFSYSGLLDWSEST